MSVHHVLIEMCWGESVEQAVVVLLVMQQQQSEILLKSVDNKEAVVFDEGKYVLQ